LGAHFSSFAGWEVPTYFTSIVSEHLHVRCRVGFFDISHMGEFRVRGKDAAQWLNRMVSGDVARLRPGDVHYALLMREDGGIVDDLVVCRCAPDDYTLVVNASNIEKDHTWLSGYLPAGVALVDRSEARGIFSVQGPASMEVVRAVVGDEVQALGYYTFLEKKDKSFGDILVSRTGYTGELGFEIFFDLERAPILADRVFEAGRAHSIEPIGFGARDTLRIEACMPLYGHELTDETTPIEAGLKRFVSFEKGDFHGRSVLAKQVEEGTSRKLVAVELVGHGILRDGCRVWRGDEEIGTVTSGTYSPLLRKSIGLGYVPAALSAIGTELAVDIRGRRHGIRVVKKPFYRGSALGKT